MSLKMRRHCTQKALVRHVLQIMAQKRSPIQRFFFLPSVKDKAEILLHVDELLNIKEELSSQVCVYGEA